MRTTGTKVAEVSRPGHEDGSGSGQTPAVATVAVLRCCTALPSHHPLEVVTIYQFRNLLTLIRAIPDRRELMQFLARLRSQMEPTA